MAIVAVVTEFELTTCLKPGRQRGVLDDSGGTTETEEHRVRAAVDGNAFGVVGVERDGGSEIIARGIGRGEATQPGGRIGEAALRIEVLVRARIRPGRGIVAADAVDLRAGRVD